VSVTFTTTEPVLQEQVLAADKPLRTDWQSGQYRQCSAQIL